MESPFYTPTHLHKVHKTPENHSELQNHIAEKTYFAANEKQTLSLCVEIQRCNFRAFMHVPDIIVIGRTLVSCILKTGHALMAVSRQQGKQKGVLYVIVSGTWTGIIRYLLCIADGNLQ